MSELKAGVLVTPHNEGMCFHRSSAVIAAAEGETEFYLKSEADKFIEDLEESHKKEVEQLLMEIVELKADYKEACDRLQTANLIKDEQKAKTDKLLSCLKCLVIRDLIKDCPEKVSAIETVKEYK